jgi:ADP-heptose:LPS heptosyltransferase
MFFKNKSKEITLQKFREIQNKICIYRGIGGLGDIIAMRMIFEDLKNQYPEFEITWAVPFALFAAAEQHPFVDSLIHLDSYNKHDYLETYDITTICGKQEAINKKGPWKNRSDIWAEYFGLKLENHNLHMPRYPNHHKNVLQRIKKLGWDGNKKLVAFCPRSAISLKNMTFEQIQAVKEMTKDFFLFGLHHAPLLEFDNLKIPAVYNFTLHECLASIEISDFVIATDTGLMHVAAGYKKPTLATFSFVDGETYCKYYETVQVVQLHMHNIENWCGPCYDYPRCPHSKIPNVKPCQTEITPKMLQENWAKLLNRV